MVMQNNRYSGLWFPAIGLHALHQIEEGISFFSWYADHAALMPGWIRIISASRAETWAQHPDLFALVSAGQIIAVSTLAMLFRRNEAATRFLLLLYLLGITFFFGWHILSAYLAHAYAPIMVTSIGGFFFLPRWFKTLLKPAGA